MANQRTPGGASGGKGKGKPRTVKPNTIKTPPDAAVTMSDVLRACDFLKFHAHDLISKVNQMRASKPELSEGLDSIANVLLPYVQGPRERGQSKQPVSEEFCKEIRSSIERNLTSRYPGATSHESVLRLREEHRWKLLGNSAIPFDTLADLIHGLNLPIDALINHAPWPWDTFLPGQSVLICVGVTDAKREKADRAYGMAQVDDLTTALFLHDYFGRAGLGCRPQISPFRCRNGEAQAVFDELLKPVHEHGAIIVIASQNANQAAKPATKWILENGHDGFSLEPSKRLVLPEGEPVLRTAEKAGKQDAGLVRIRRGRHNGHVKIVCVVEGLGPVGTLAAAEALTSMHEIAETALDGKFANAVVIEDLPGFLQAVKETGCGRSHWKWHDD